MLVTMFRKLLFSFAIFAVLLAFAMMVFETKFRPKEQKPLSIPKSVGYLSGKVSKPNGWMPFVLPGIPGAKVSLAPGGKTVVTDQEGFFAIPEVSPGVHTVTIAKEGFETAVIDGVGIGGGRVTTVPDQALFIKIEGPPKAHLVVGSPVPFKKLPDAYPYLTTVYLDAKGSENISRYGIRWEIRDEKGQLLRNAEDGGPLQLEPSPIPGTSPALFLFKPPNPGTFAVKIILNNLNAPGIEDAAEVEVRAVNTKPEAIPAVIAGPNPPQKIPDGKPRSSSGLDVVKKGDEVYLMGLGFDRNHASPELYNPGGLDGDTYGKNHDHLQRQFGFEWRLFHAANEGTNRTEVSSQLIGPDGKPTRDGQVLHFVADKPGRFYAMLVVQDKDPYGSLASEQASVSILCVDDNKTLEEKACQRCHRSQVAGYNLHVHKEAEVGCESCHGPATAHLAISQTGFKDAESYQKAKRATQDVSHESGVCGQCHDEYAEWEKSNHSDGMSYGYYEIAKPLLIECTKCHYARPFVDTLKQADEEGVDFHDVHFKVRAMSIGPLMPDLSKLPKKDETGISCVTCHRVHESKNQEHLGIPTKTSGKLCQTCHREKWQNAVLEGVAGQFQNGFEYPKEAYNLKNPHNTTSKCNLCHHGNQTSARDKHGVRAVGGHTLRMRDTGPNGIPGGFGPRRDHPDKSKSFGDEDDILHIAPCQECHEGLETFDRNGFQSKIHSKWVELGNLLKAANNGALPGFPPGDKCAICHRGGTLPFDDDKKLIFENAYTNYKLIKNDRSFGIHNPKYVLKLLEDSIKDVKANLSSHE